MRTHNTIYQHENVTIQHQTDKNNLRLEWKGDVSLPLYKDALTHCLDYAQEHQVRKFLINQTQLNQVPPEAQHWLMNEWFPAVEHSVAGTLSFGIVPSQLLYRRIASNKAAHQLRQSSQKSRVHYFKDESAALNWLEEQ